MTALVSVFGIHLPAYLTHPFGIDGGIINLPSVLIVLCLTMLLI
ncbi:MAG: hypothetical protein WC620_04345 [Methanoregula sp.]